MALEVEPTERNSNLLSITNFGQDPTESIFREIYGDLWHRRRQGNDNATRNLIGRIMQNKRVACAARTYMNNSVSSSEKLQREITTFSALTSTQAYSRKSLYLIQRCTH